jgi:hypothetical protein
MQENNSSKQNIQKFPASFSKKLILSGVGASLFPLDISVPLLVASCLFPVAGHQGAQTVPHKAEVVLVGLGDELGVVDVFLAAVVVPLVDAAAVT